MVQFEEWIQLNTDTVFYLWVKSRCLNREYADNSARTCKIYDFFSDGNETYIGVKFCETTGKIYSQYIEYYGLSEVRLGIPDFAYENTHERGDIKNG